METLLISPASREEVVYGKFLTIWVFSAATALLNLGSMAVTTAVFGGLTAGAGAPPVALLPASALGWCVVLLLPLSAFFSALCLAMGAYARSSKEGQYYLMPLFLVTLPLIFLTLVPGVGLNAFYSLMPVTGVALLLQRLMVEPDPLQKVWPYFVPVLGPTVLYGWLALRWAVTQFQREEVLFREAERLDVGLWLRRLFREKEPLPSVGQAVFCFVLIVGLRALTLGVGAAAPSPLRDAVGMVAFVVTPPVFMALVLTTRPVEGLALRVPPPGALFSAVLLVLVLALPLAELPGYFLREFPAVEKLFRENDPVAQLEQLLPQGGEATWGLAVLVLLAPVCEELAFRGFILVGLRQRFHPWTAILLSAFFFALYHLNVYEFIPQFVLGVILGLIATRSRSVLPGMLFHLAHNGLLLAPKAFPGWAAGLDRLLGAAPGLRVTVVVGCAVLAAGYLAVSGFRLWASGRDPWWDEIPGRQGDKETGRQADRETA
jgi:sodium transport system permease protein